MECLNTVNELNSELYEKFEECEELFYYSTNGNIDIIGFGDTMLWNSEDDGREFNEEINDYEPLTPFIKKLFNQYIDRISLFHF